MSRVDELRELVVFMAEHNLDRLVVDGIELVRAAPKPEPIVSEPHEPEMPDDRFRMPPELHNYASRDLWPGGEPPSFDDQTGDEARGVAPMK